jgi:hypothetical protein
MMKSAQSFCIYTTAEIQYFYSKSSRGGVGGRGGGGVGGDWEAHIKIIENLRWLLSVD